MSTAKAIWITIGAIVGAVALSFGIWGLTVALSPVKGAGDAYIIKNSAANWTAAQARFEDQYQEIIALDRTVNLHAEALAAAPDDRTLQTNYTGAQAVCYQAVADYNAEAHKYLSSEWRSEDLPQQISELDGKTDCK